MCQVQMRCGRRIDMINTRPERALTRSIGYLLVIAALLAGAFVFGKMTWKGNGELHTLLETIATVLLLICGVMSLVRYYTKKSSAFLILGGGFLGTALLNGYHGAITSSFLVGRTPSALSALSLWSGAELLPVCSWPCSCVRGFWAGRWNRGTRRLADGRSSLFMF